MHNKILQDIESAESLIELAAKEGEEHLTLTALEWLVSAVKQLAQKVDQLEAARQAKELGHFEDL